MAHHQPSYYRRGTIEVWDFIRDQRLNYHLGNAVKYICRAGHKECYVTDLTKAIHYLQNDAHAQRKSRTDGTGHSRSSRHIQQTLIAEEFSEFVEAARQIYDKKFYRE